jgi:hypothetical protein
MRRSVWFGVVFGASAALLSGSEASAEDVAPATPAASDAAPAAKPKPKPSKPMVTVSVLNKRTVALKSMTAIATGAEGDPKKVIGVVKPDKGGVGHIARTKDCQYDLHGDYEDGSVFEASGVDLCNSGGFNLKD